MKKTIFTLTMCLIAVLGFSQTDTLSYGDYTMRWIQNDSKSWQYTIQDTVTAEDTLFFVLDTTLIAADTIVDGNNDTTLIVADTIPFYHDTILGNDTIMLTFPNEFGNGFSGMMTVVSDSIIGAAQGDVTVKLLQAACDTCNYYFITGTDAAHTAPPDDSNKFFQLRGTRLRLLIIAVNGTSYADVAIILKPSAISNNASN